MSLRKSTKRKKRKHKALNDEVLFTVNPAPKHIPIILNLFFQKKKHIIRMTKYVFFIIYPSYLRWSK